MKCLVYLSDTTNSLIKYFIYLKGNCLSSMYLTRPHHNKQSEILSIQNMIALIYTAQHIILNLTNVNQKYKVFM